MGRASKYTRELLQPLVETSRSFAEVMRRLGLPPTGGNFRMIQARIRIACLDTSHFRARKKVDRLVPEDRLRELVSCSTSVAQVLAALGRPTAGRPHAELRGQIRDLGIDTSHFRGEGWARGETKQTHPSIRLVSEKAAFSDDQVFIENGPFLSGNKLVRRLLALGWPYRCAWCGLDEWRGSRLVLQLDHINGVSNDHRLENLRLLCPNCHSQTDTYCNRAREAVACYTFAARERGGMVDTQRLGRCA